jgi:hypothetical protein
MPCQSPAAFSSASRNMPPNRALHPTAREQCAAAGERESLDGTTGQRETTVRECVKCGQFNAPGAQACGRCTWPFSRKAWDTTTQRLRRITLDTGCINAKGFNHDLNTLERWAAHGQIVLQRSDAMLAELHGEARIEKAKALTPHPGLLTFGVSIYGGPDVFAGPDLSSEIEYVLFPTAHPLTSNQGHDVEHLRLHVRTGGDVFVTLNPNDFVTRGRQEELRSWGIWVLSPAESVRLLGDLYGWK